MKKQNEIRQLLYDHSFYVLANCIEFTNLKNIDLSDLVESEEKFFLVDLMELNTRMEPIITKHKETYAMFVKSIEEILASK